MTDLLSGTLDLHGAARVATNIRFFVRAYRRTGASDQWPS